MYALLPGQGKVQLSRIDEETKTGYDLSYG